MSDENAGSFHPPPEASLERSWQHSESPEELLEGPKATQDADPLMDQLSGRIGSLQIAEDGQLRFYGATSNLHILHNGPLSLSRSYFRSLQNGEEMLRRTDVGHFVDTDLEDHLLKLYFCWEDPSIHVVDEDVFWRERNKCRASNQVSYVYSEVLTNAMCAVGATLTSRHYPHLPEPLADFFATRAKVLLELEMDAPKLSTVQSLVVLSAVEALLARDARGWLDSGMAVRVAVDLGLHLDPQPYVEAGIIEPEEAMLRNEVWGGVFVHDRMWSLYVGRPVGIDDKNITAPFPRAKGQHVRYWEPYIDDCEGLDLPRLANPIEEISMYNITLCAKMNPIRETLYPDGATGLQGLRNLYSFATKTRSQLFQWHAGLPESLTVNETDPTRFYLPHVLQLQ